MHVLPILSTLRRHRTAATLIVLQIAVTCAIVCNAVFIISARLDRMERPSGVAEDELVRLMVTGVSTGVDTEALTRADLEALAAIPGVKSVANSNMVPFSNSSWNSSMSTIPDDHETSVNAGMYMGSPDLLETFGVELIAGRDFERTEYLEFEDVQKNQTHITSAIVTRDLAEQLYPDEDAVGKPIYVFGDRPTTIVGVIERLARPSDFHHKQEAGYAAIFPVNLPFDQGGYNYLLRVEPGRQDEALDAAVAAIKSVDPNQIILERQRFAKVRADFFREDKAMAYLLIGVCVGLLVITALGIVGLASFWVQQRTRQIGIRRALGATRGQILGYFHTENFILASFGIVLGMGLAYALNLWLMDKYGVPRLPAEFLPIGAILLWFLGQVAVVGPALRASTIPPAIATRTV
jgi:putative ABC transport system permease protein